MYFRKVFSKIDVNNNGQIGPNELLEFYNSFSEEREDQEQLLMTSQESMLLIQEFDVSQNGQLNYSEF